MKYKMKLLLLLLVTVLLLSGCMLTVDEMYRLPKRSDVYNDLQTSIDSAMAGLTYCAPLTGENQQTIQMADLDGDGIEEYLLFAKSAEERPLRILVFRNVDGQFVNTNTVACNGSAFDRVEYVDMDGLGGVEIVIGRKLSDQLIRSVSIYTFAEDELVQIVSTNYSKFLTTDLDADGAAELFVLRPGQMDTDNGVAELYRIVDGTMERYNEVAMSQPVDQLKRVIVGKLDGGKAAVYVACTAGDNALITDVYTLSDGMLKNVTRSNESGTSVQTLRNFYIYADDIDNDTVVELPHLITMKSMDETAPKDTHQLIRWYAMTPDGGEIDKMYTYHNFVGGWYLQLESKLVPRLFVLNQGYHYEFYLWDAQYQSTQKILTIYVFTAQNREEQGSAEGRYVLHRTDSTVYSVQMEDCAADYGLNHELVAHSFQLIQQDWKTGET